MNFTSINFLNNEEIVNYDNNILQDRNNINDINGVTPGNQNNNLMNKDNNMSKSQFKEYMGDHLNINFKDDYYSSSQPKDEENQQNNFNNNINNNDNIITNNQNQNRIENININDKFDFDISPLKPNDNQLKKDSLIDNLNNLDSIDNINNINNNDSLKKEKMAERQEDKKRGKVMDRIVKGRARMNDNNKNINNIKGSFEKSKLLEKVLGNNDKNKEED